MSALLAGGADPNYKGKGNTTPLMYASQEGRADNVATLLAGGADLNASDDEGTTSLLYASRKSANEAVVTALLAAGAGVDAHEDDGRTPLFEAACHGVLAIARALLAAGADVHRTCTPSKAVPLHLAAQEEAVEMVALLLEAGASVDVADATDETPIFFTARKDHPAVVGALVASGAAVDARNAVGGTSLGDAITASAAGAVRSLLAASADVARPVMTASHATVTHVAVAAGTPDTAIYLSTSLVSTRRRGRRRERVAHKQTGLASPGAIHRATLTRETVGEWSHGRCQVGPSDLREPPQPAQGCVQRAYSRKSACHDACPGDLCNAFPCFQPRLPRAPSRLFLRRERCSVTVRPLQTLFCLNRLSSSLRNC